MKNIIRSLILLTGIVGTGALSAPDARAQSITLGGDDTAIFRLLQQNGYTSPKVTKRGLTIIRTEACKGRDKYQVKVSILGRITSTAKIGTCAIAQPVRFGESEAKSALEQAGYSRIQTRRQGAFVSASACREGRSYQFGFNRRGDVTDRQDVGPCRSNGMTKERLAELLQREGYRRIVITDDQLPRYAAEACRNGDRLRLQMNRRGIIRSERRIGQCGRQLDPNTIAALLERNGFDRVEVVDKRRPPYVAQACRDQNKFEISIGRYGRLLDERRIGRCRTRINPANLAQILGKDGYDRVNPLRTNRAPYLVEACKGNALVELTIGRFGRIRNEERVGRCAAPVTKDALVAKLQQQGYINVGVKKAANGWRADVCREENKLALAIDAYGDVLRERKAGECQSQTVLQVLKTLESRGANKTRIVVEGCYRGSQYKWAFDRLGNRTGRTRLGNC